MSSSSSGIPRFCFGTDFRDTQTRFASGPANHPKKDPFRTPYDELRIHRAKWDAIRFPDRDREILPSVVVQTVQSAIETACTLVAGSVLCGSSFVKISKLTKT